MGFYFLQLLIFLIYSFAFYFVTAKKQIRYYLIVVFLHLSLVMGLRSYLVGTDTIAYTSYYLNQNTSFNSNGVVIYNLLSKFIYHTTNGDYKVFILVLSSLSILFFILSLSKLEHNFGSIFLSVYIFITYYFYFDSFNMQRQMLAVSLAMYSVCLFIEKKNWKSFIFLLLAIGIHSTALLALINFLLVKIKKNGKSLLMMMGLSMVLLVYYDKIIQIFSRFFSHYDMYENSMNNEALSAGGGVFILGAFFILIALICFMLVKTNENNLFSFTLFSTVIGSLFYLVGSSSQLIIRIANYILIFTPVFIPVAIQKISNRFVEKLAVKLFFIFIVMVAGLVIMYYKLSNNFSGVIPYSTSIDF